MMNCCFVAHHDSLGGVLKDARPEKKGAHHEACCHGTFHHSRETALHLPFHENDQEDTYELLRYELCQWQSAVTLSRDSVGITFSYRSALSPRAAKMASVQASSLAAPVKLKKASVDRSASWNAMTSTSASGADVCVSARRNNWQLCGSYTRLASPVP